MNFLFMTFCERRVSGFWSIEFPKSCEDYNPSRAAAQSKLPASRQRLLKSQNPLSWLAVLTLSSYYVPIRHFSSPLLVYWLPAYIYDYWLQFPSYDGVHVFSDFLSNWGQTMILLHLLFSLFMDLIPDEDRDSLKFYHNIFTQIAVVQVTVTVSNHYLFS